MRLPYGENEGDIWTGRGSEVQARLDQGKTGQTLLHEMVRRGSRVEEVMYVSDDPGLIARARVGDKIRGTVLCPRCERERFTPYRDAPGMLTFVGPDYPPPALSRVDNTSYICTPCGQDEAMRDFAGEPPIPPDEWPIGMRESGSFGEFGIGHR